MNAPKRIAFALHTADTPDSPCAQCGRGPGSPGWCARCYPPPQTALDLRVTPAAWLLKQLRYNRDGVLAFAQKRGLLASSLSTGEDDVGAEPAAWWDEKTAESAREPALRRALESGQARQFALWKIGFFAPRNATPAVSASLAGLDEKCLKNNADFIRSLTRVETHLAASQRWLYELVESPESIFLPPPPRSKASPDQTVPGVPR